MKIEAEQFGKILKSLSKLLEILGYGKNISLSKWCETESGDLQVFFIENMSNEELIFTIPKPKEQ